MAKIQEKQEMCKKNPRKKWCNYTYDIFFTASQQ